MLLYFDNYGKFLCEGNPGTLKEIHHYLYQMAAGKSNRTFCVCFNLPLGTAGNIQRGDEKIYEGIWRDSIKEIREGQVREING